MKCPVCGKAMAKKCPRELTEAEWLKMQVSYWMNAWYRDTHKNVSQPTKRKNMKTKLGLLVCILAAAFSLTACRTPTLESGGAYAPTNTLGQVLYNDVGLTLADASYKLAYNSALAVFGMERNYRAAIWELSPNIKHALDKARLQVVDINLRWARARKLYKANPTPAGLTAMQTILAELQRIVPVIQDQMKPVYQTLTTPQ